MTEDNMFRLAAILVFSALMVFLWFITRTTSKRVKKRIKNLPHLQIEIRPLSRDEMLYSLIEIDQKEGYTLTVASTLDPDIATAWANDLQLKIEPTEVVQARINGA